MIAVIDPNQQGKYKAFYLFSENADEEESLKTIASILPKFFDGCSVEFISSKEPGGPALQFYIGRIEPALGSEQYDPHAGYGLNWPYRK